MVQNETIKSPIRCRAGIAHRIACNLEVRRAHVAEKTIHLHARLRALIGRARQTWRGRTADPASPGIGGLIGRAIRVVAARGLRNIHQDEGIQRDLIAALFERPDRTDHGLIRRRAAIDRCVITLGHQMRVSSGQSCYRPVQRTCGFLARLNARPDLASAAAQIIAKPAGDQRHRSDLRQARGQVIQRRLKIGERAAGVNVLGQLLAFAQLAIDRLCRIDELARGRDQTHALNQVFKLRLIALILARAQHFEAQIGQARAIGVEREILKHHVSEAAKGGRRALHRLDQRIRRLIGRAGMKPHHRRVMVQQFAIRPDASDAGHRTFAQGDRKARGILILGDLRPALAAAGAARSGGFGDRPQPDHLPGETHPAIDDRHEGALGRGLDAEALKTRALLV